MDPPTPPPRPPVALGAGGALGRRRDRLERLSGTVSLAPSASDSFTSTGANPAADARTTWSPGSTGRRTPSAARGTGASSIVTVGGVRPAHRDEHLRDPGRERVELALGGRDRLEELLGRLLRRSLADDAAVRLLGRDPLAHAHLGAGDAEQQRRRVDDGVGAAEPIERGREDLRCSRASCPPRRASARSRDRRRRPARSAAGARSGRAARSDPSRRAIRSEVGRSAAGERQMPRVRRLRLAARAPRRRGGAA